jgi:hypothetical protein
MASSHAEQFYNDDVFLIDAVAAFITAGSQDKCHNHRGGNGETL